MTKPEILNIKEVAALLRVAEKTAYTLAQSGELPGFKVGGQWRFRRRYIESWIDEQTKRSRDGGDGRR